MTGSGPRLDDTVHVTPGQEAYYEQDVARGLDDYYAGRGEWPGLWPSIDVARPPP